MRSSVRRCLLAALASLSALPPLAADPGPGDLLVAPTRVVFEGRDRNSEITLVNTGTSPATYRITFVELRMDELGGTREIAAAEATPDELAASGLIRYFPRQVLLEPGVAQTVRLQLRKPEGLAEGEYRSHLLFRAVPAGEPEPGEAAAAGIAIDLKAIFGVSVPVIVRHGDSAAAARLADLRLETAQGGAPPKLAFRLERSGSSSLYGNLTATLTPRGGKPLVLAAANGVALYTPNLARRSSLELRLPPAANLAGELRLAYASPAGEILAESRLVLP
jgi:P pilus assembly chaperone PapD